jgi:hypothetical protein
LIMKRVVMSARLSEYPSAPPADLFLDLTPQLVMAARSELDASWRALPSRASYNRIYFIEDGDGRVNLAGREIVLRPGNLYFLPAHTPVGYQTDRRVVIQWLHCCLGPASGVELGAFLPCRNEVTPATRPDSGTLRPPDSPAWCGRHHGRLGGDAGDPRTPVTTAGRLRLTPG